MRCPAVLLIFILFLPAMTACSQMPVIRHDAVLNVKPVGEVCCSKPCLPFVSVPYRLIHAMEAELPDGTVTAALGVVLVDPHGDSLHCVLMTPEGFVLLDVVDDREITVRRGVPPFNHPVFAARMMADMRLMLLPPRGRLRDAGHLKDGTAICRYSDEEGKMIDIVASKDDDRREIRQYDSSGFLRRLICLSPDGQAGIFGKIELEAPSFTGYALQLTLIEAEPLK